MSNRVYIDVLVAWGREGRILPRAIKWTDGMRYPVGRVLDMRPAASLKTGGAGTRYTVRIGGEQRFLFLDGERWFMEQ
ncbi:MAG: hypothetical protein Q4C72_07145 [Eubacteriales bacterium]|nr:hypothetical protein [Eubacteriales bacterium]